MDPQRYIIAKIEPEMNEAGKFPWLKFISETSLLPVESFPALLVEDVKPFGSEGQFGDGTALQSTGEYMLSLLIDTKNLKGMTRADYKTAKGQIIKRVNEIQNHIAECLTASPTLTEDGEKVMIAGMKFEAGELEFVEIDSRPALMLSVPVKTVYYTE